MLLNARGNQKAPWQSVIKELVITKLVPASLVNLEAS